MYLSCIKLNKQNTETFDEGSLFFLLLLFKVNINIPGHQN